MGTDNPAPLTWSPCGRCFWRSDNKRFDIVLTEGPTGGRYVAHDWDAGKKFAAATKREAELWCEGRPAVDAEAV